MNTQPAGASAAGALVSFSALSHFKDDDEKDNDDENDQHHEHHDDVEPQRRELEKWWNHIQRHPAERNNHQLVSRSTEPFLHALSRLAHHLSFSAARFIRRETRLRVQIRNTMAYVSSIGGGWASVRHSRNARICAEVLGQLAALVGDETTVRRCRIFAGYHSHWEGAAADAYQKFNAQLVDAESNRDSENAAHCEHGIRNLLWHFGDDAKKLKKKKHHRQQQESSKT